MSHRCRCLQTSLMRKCYCVFGAQINMRCISVTRTARADSRSISRCVGPSCHCASAEGYNNQCHRGAEAFAKQKCLPKGNS